MDGGAWWAAVHGVAGSQTRLSDFTFTFTFMHWRRKWQPTPLFLPGAEQRASPAAAGQGGSRVSVDSNWPPRWPFFSVQIVLCSNSRFLPLTHSSFLSAFSRESQPHGPGQAS